MRAPATRIDVEATAKYLAHVMKPQQIKDPEWEISVWEFLSPYKTGHKEILYWSYRGDPDARRIASELLKRAMQEVGQGALPEPLYSYSLNAYAGTLPPVNHRGRRFKNLARNFWIWVAVWLCQRRKFLPTSNRKADGLRSASQLVAKLLAEHGMHLSPATIEGIAQKPPRLTSAGMLSNVADHI